MRGIVHAAACRISSIVVKDLTFKTKNLRSVDRRLPNTWQSHRGSHRQLLSRMSKTAGLTLLVGRWDDDVVCWQNVDVVVYFRVEDWRWRVEGPRTPRHNDQLHHRPWRRSSAGRWITCLMERVCQTAGCRRSRRENLHLILFVSSTFYHCVNVNVNVNLYSAHRRKKRL